MFGLVVQELFEKGYEANWTEEIFTIATRIPRDLVVYRIKDYKGEILEGVFYKEERQKVEAKAPGDTYVAVKILKRKKVGRNKLIFVKWRGYPSSMNGWIPKSGLVTL